MAVSPRSSVVGVTKATASSWGTASAVGAGDGVWVTDDLKASLSMQVDEDNSAGQGFITSMQVANHNVVKAEIPTFLHYNDEFQNLFWAMACGTGGVSTFEPATNKTGMFVTIVRDKVEFISEIPSAKCTGFELSFGDNGRAEIVWMFTGTKEVVDSAINTSTQISALTYPTQGRRAFFKQLSVWIATAGATTLSTSNAVRLTDLKFRYEQPLDELFVNGQDYVIEPEDNEYPTIELDFTFARLDTTSEAYIGYHRDNTALKCQLLLTGTSTYSMKFEFPRLIVKEAPVEFNGAAENVSPTVKFGAYKATAAPTGMSVTAPFRITTVGDASTNYFS